MRNVFIAMSGGFDSFMSAYFLKKAGFKVTGVTFALTPVRFFSRHGYDGMSGNSALKAADLCKSLSIPHYVIDLSDIFLARVIEPFIAGYRHGVTPNPCVACNRYVKFEAFLNEALLRGADLIATGHYARIERNENDIVLKKALDVSKDQSYFLYAVDKEALAKTIFPLSGLRKKELRIFARQENINFPESESQDVCFIPRGKNADFLSRFIKQKKGRIFHTNGAMIGYHEGIHLYTIGQRRGLNIPFSEPLYVVELRADENVIIAGSRKDLVQHNVTARSVRMLASSKPEVCAKVRYRQPEQPCSFNVSDDRLCITFNQAVDAVTPGQSVVMYADDIVVGGGIIEKRSCNVTGPYYNISQKKR